MKLDQHGKPPDKKSLTGFFVTLGLDAFNDNALKVALSLLVLAKMMPGEGGAMMVSAASAVFILPFLIFSSFAGSLADRISKRSIMIGAKVWEVLVMTVAAVGFYLGSIPTIFTALFLMGVQSAIFGPAKYAIIPELVDAGALAKTNGKVEAVTFLAIICGTAGGSMLIPLAGERWVGLFLIAIATLGVLSSLRIPAVPAASSNRPLSMNPLGEVVQTLRNVRRDSNVWAPLLGLAWFWFFGAFLQMSILLFAKQTLALSDTRTGLLLTALAMSIGLGSLLAGRWSDKKIEIGLIPLGAAGMAVFTLDLSFAETAARAAVDLFFLGIFAGLFIVPQDAMVQHKSGAGERGRVIAASNFLIFSGILLSSGAFTLISDGFGATPAWTLRIAGLMAALVAAYLLWRLATAMFRLLAWLLTHTLFDITIRGAENIPHHGPAILAANHTSFFDMCLVGGCMQRVIRFLMLQEYFESRWARPVCRLMRAIPFKPGNGVEALEEAAEELKAGKVICIFPEGQISRNGQLLPFRKGIEILAQKTGAPIVPVHIDGMRGGPFTEDTAGKMTILPRCFPWRVTISFGEALRSESTVDEVRTAVVRLGSLALGSRPAVRSTLPKEFVKSAVKNWNLPAVADSTGRQMSYGRLLTASMLLKKTIDRRFPGKSVGLLLPTSVGAAVANLAVGLSGKVAVNFNFTTSAQMLRACAERCGVRQVITSRKFLEKTGMKSPAEPIYLEDLVGEIPKARRILMYAALRLIPAPALIRILKLGRIQPDDIAAVIFSSGSSGAPKGVMLSHANVLANISSLTDLFYERSDDRILGVLPFFHSFGWMGTFWYPLIRGYQAIYHPNPMDSRIIAQLAKRHRATFMVSTPTFCRMYLRHIPAEYFSSLRTLIVGAERLQAELCKQLQATYRVEVLEGYGATECSPVISVNLPDVTLPGKRQRGMKPGTVGRPVPGVAVKVVDPETHEELPLGSEGLLLVSGPNVMRGYWEDSERTAKAMRDGWYVTGDMARIDSAGFISITGRLSRFAKIGGEMVPLEQIEEGMHRILGRTDRVLAVTAVSEESRGERIVVVHAEEVEPKALMERMRAEGYPNLWIPKSGDFIRVDALPVLGTGKLDCVSIRRIAESQPAMAAEACASGSRE